MKQREYANKRRNATETSIEIGDQVLLKQSFRQNKLSSCYEPSPYKVVQLDGSTVQLENPSGIVKRRATSHVKRYNTNKPIGIKVH